MGMDRCFVAAQLAHDLADDDARRTATCMHCGKRSDEGKRLGILFLCTTCSESGEVCARCGEDAPTQVRRGEKVCLDCAWVADHEGDSDEDEREEPTTDAAVDAAVDAATDELADAAAEESTPKPIGTCPRCGAPQYIPEGFCGGCHPGR